jgi:O-antigen/teichoic acid export membrane protein
MSAEVRSPAELDLKGRLRFLLGDTLIYGGAAAITRSFTIITFPLIAGHFSVQEYGTLDYFIVLGGVLTALLVFGQDSSVARYYYDHKNIEDRKQLISQSLLFQLSLVTIFLLISILTIDQISDFIITTEDRKSLFKIVLFQVPFLLIINFSINLLKWTFKKSSYLIMSIGATILQACLLVVALLVFDVGISGVLLVNLACNLVFAGLGLFLIRSWLIFPTDLKLLRRSISFAVPYGLIGALGAITPLIERTMTHDLLGAEALGLYAAAVKITAILGLIISAFQMAWGPFALSIYNRADACETFNSVLRAFTLLMCVAALALVLFAERILEILVSDRYSAASIVVPPLAIGLAIQAISWITEVGIGISKKSYLLLYAYAFSIPATLIGIYFLTPVLGLQGVGLAVLFGLISKSVVSSWLAYRAHPIEWNYFWTCLLVLVTIVSACVGLILGDLFGYLYRAIILSLSIIILLSLGLLNYLYEKRRKVRSAVTLKNIGLADNQD